MLQINKASPTRRKVWNDFADKKSSLSVHLNIAEGASRKSETERKRFYEVARGSVVEIDATLDIANSLHYLDNFNLDNLKECTIKTFKILYGMI